MDIHPSWQAINVETLRGTLLVIGEPDAGKTTFACWLYGALARTGGRTAYLDGDAGQSLLGPPTTMSLVIGAPGDITFPPRLHHRHWFVGHVSPRGHTLPLLVGAQRLADVAWERGVTVLVYDSDGLVDARQGGVTLKHALIDVLRPSVVFAIQHDRELEDILMPLRLSRRARIIDLPASPAVLWRNPATRRANRAQRFAAHFRTAEPIELDWSRLGVFPRPQFLPNQLVALEDSAGFALALGVVVGQDRPARTVSLLTPLSPNRLPDIAALRLGDLTLDPATWETRQVAWTTSQKAEGKRRK